MFWVPLALMWIIMGVEQPALNAVMARLPNATRNLAAFEIAFGLAVLIESPILQMLSAATALVNGPRTYAQLSRFMRGWALLLCSMHALLTIRPVFRFVAGDLLAAPADLIEPARSAFVILIPFAALVGYRRLWQGALIRVGRTKLVGRTMVVRLVCTIGGLAGGLVVHRLGVAWAPEGHHIAAISLISGVAAGAGASYVYQRRVVFEYFSRSTEEEEPWTTRRLLAFYIPLSLTSVMSLASRPLLAFGMNRSVLPVRSLAAWPTIQGYLFLYNSIALSYQEAVIAKSSEDRDSLGLLRRFAIGMALFLTFLYLAVAFTGGLRGWFASVAALPAHLVAIAVQAGFTLAAMPAAVTARSYLSGMLVARHETRSLSVAVVLNITVLFFGVLFLPRWTEMIGTHVAAVSFLSANLVQAGALIVAGRRSFA